MQTLSIIVAGDPFLVPARVSTVSSMQKIKDLLHGHKGHEKSSFADTKNPESSAEVQANQAPMGGYEAPGAGEVTDSAGKPVVASQRSLDPAPNSSEQISPPGQQFAPAKSTDPLGGGDQPALQRQAKSL